MDEDRNVKDEDEFQGAAEERTADEETEGADLFSNLETENVPYNDEEELNPVVEQQVEESEEFEAEHIYVPSKDRYADDNEEEEEKDDDNDAVLLPRSPPPQDETNVSNYSSDIMVEEGYLPGVDDLPLFATKEAKLIDASNKEAEISVEALSEELRDLNDRIKIMKEHFKNVMQEVEHTNALFVSKQAEIHTESHLHQLSIRALGRGRSDTKKEQDEFDTLQSQLNTVHNETYKANEKLDEFKFQMKWNQEELEKWALAAKQKEDDQLALERYSRADEHKVKELTLMQEHLTREMQTVVTRLEGELTDTRAKQMELDRVAAEFRDTHIERQTLLTRWQDTIEEMKRRDDSINELGERFAVAKAERAQKEQRLNIQLRRLTAQSAENKSVEAKSELLSRLVSRKREEMILGAQKLKEFKDEMEAIKNELTTTSERLVIKRAENNHKNSDLEEKRVLLERQRQKYQAVKAKLEIAKGAAMRTEMTVKQVEDELAEHERDLEARLLRVKALKDRQFKEAQLLHDLKMEEHRMHNQVDGIRLTSRSMEMSLTALDKETARQQELLYNAEFQIQQSERKVARAMGVRSDTEKRELKLQIEEAEGKLEHIKETRKILVTQARKLLNELAASRMHREVIILKRSTLTEKIGEIELENRMIEEEIRRGTKTKEEITVLNDLLRLDVRRLRDLLSSKADAVFSLENRKQQMMLSLEERKQEVAVHRDLLKAELRSKKEEKHTITLDLRARELAVEKLRARFEAVSNAKGGSNEEGHSQAHYIILAAQRREELQRKGDELDANIRKCEKEIRALQATLDHLNVRNTAFRASFQKVSVEGDDFEILTQLEERNKMSKDNLFRKKKEMQRLATDYEEDHRRLAQIQSKTSRADKQKEHLESAKAAVDEEILTQQVQLDELSEKIRRLVLQHRGNGAELSSLTEEKDRGAGASSAPENKNAALSIEEKAVKAEVYRDVIQNVLYTLSQLVMEFPEAADVFHLRTQEAELKLPTRMAGQADLRGKKPQSQLGTPVTLTSYDLRM